MSTEIIFAASLWLIITLTSPSKIRIFISLLSAGLIFILLFFSLISPRELVVSVPSFGDDQGYELPYEDFKQLTDNPIVPNVIATENAEDLSQLGKDILTYKDLTADQRQALEALEDYPDFSEGRTGIIPRYVAPTVREGKLVPGFYGIEFAPLPLYKELERKSGILDAIRHMVNENEDPHM